MDFLAAPLVNDMGSRGEVDREISVGHLAIAIDLHINRRAQLHYFSKPDADVLPCDPRAGVWSACVLECHHALGYSLPVIRNAHRHKALPVGQNMDLDSRPRVMRQLPGIAVTAIEVGHSS